MDFGIAGVAAITALAYLIGQGVKASGIANKWIPVICGIVGLVLGIVALYIMPDFPADDPITAAAIGAVSGFAATGIHQAAKQQKEDNNND